MTTQWKIGDRIHGRWEVHDIKRGGMGIVYIVYDHEWKEAFAAKTFRDEIIASDPGLVDRFAVEALTWVTLDSHPNITQASFVQFIERKPFLFLEYVSGGDLSDWIGTPKLLHDLPQILRFGIQFCDGMTHAMAKGIKAHRDIKPKNCLITGDGTLKITDFGLAVAFDEPVPTTRRVPGQRTPVHNRFLSSSGIIVGTTPYMAPEQFDDGPPASVTADIYAFGVMLFVMLTGTVPFDADSVAGFAEVHRRKPCPPLEPWVFGRRDRPALEAIVQRCLVKHPGQRFQRFEAVRESLAAVYATVTGQPFPPSISGAALPAWQWHNKGFSLDNLGRHLEAIACYNIALSLDPAERNTWFNEGLAWSKLGVLEKARECFREAQRLGHPEAKSVLDETKRWRIIPPRR